MSLSASSAPQFDPRVRRRRLRARVCHCGRSRGSGTYDVAGQHVASDGSLQGRERHDRLLGARRAGHPMVCRDGVPTARSSRGGPSRRGHRRVRPARELPSGVSQWLGRTADLAPLRATSGTDDRARRHGRRARRVDRPARGQRHHAARCSPTAPHGVGRLGRARGGARPRAMQQFPRSLGDGRDARSSMGPRSGTIRRRLRAARVSPTSAPVWTVNGQPVSTASGSNTARPSSPDGDTVGIVYWTDQRAGGGDIYCQRVPLVITLDAAPSRASHGALAAARTQRSARCRRVHARAQTTWTSQCTTPRATRVRTLARGARAAGAQSVAWDARDDAGHACAPGAWARLRGRGAPRLGRGDDAPLSCGVSPSRPRAATRARCRRSRSTLRAFAVLPRQAGAPSAPEPAAVGARREERKLEDALARLRTCRSPSSETSNHGMRAPGAGPVHARGRPRARSPCHVRDEIEHDAPRRSGRRRPATAPRPARVEPHGAAFEGVTSSEHLGRRRSGRTAAAAPLAREFGMRRDSSAARRVAAIALSSDSRSGCSGEIAPRTMAVWPAITCKHVVEVIARRRRNSRPTSAKPALALGFVQSISRSASAGEFLLQPLRLGAHALRTADVLAQQQHDSMSARR